MAEDKKSGVQRRSPVRRGKYIVVPTTAISYEGHSQPGDADRAVAWGPFSFAKAQRVASKIEANPENYGFEENALLWKTECWIYELKSQEPKPRTSKK